jgi:hypothetical protein
VNVVVGKRSAHRLTHQHHEDRNGREHHGDQRQVEQVRFSGQVHWLPGAWLGDMVSRRMDLIAVSR